MLRHFRVIRLQGSFRLLLSGRLCHGSIKQGEVEKTVFPLSMTNCPPSSFVSHLRRMSLMHLIWTILIGFVAGLIAKAISPGSGPNGFLMTAALGIGGSVAATYLGQALGLYSEGNVAGFLMSIAGACLLLFLYRKFARKS
jgi:uncharacterized membrane protein YeaQ/YmgE (transglycosylase-associated protein family)